MILIIELTTYKIKIPNILRSYELSLNLAFRIFFSLFKFDHIKFESIKF